MGTPSPPSPSEGINIGKQVAGDQKNLNLDAAVKSLTGTVGAGQTNPFGTLTPVQIGVDPSGVPIYRQDVNFSPEQQQLYSWNLNTKNTAGKSAAELLANANYGGAVPGDVIGNDTQGLTKRLMDTQVGYIQPYINYNRDRIATQLSNQGASPTDERYKAAMRQFDDSTDRSLGAIAGQFEPQAYSQATQNYMLPMSMATALAGFGAPTTPNSSFVNTPNFSVQSPDEIGAVNGANAALMNQYKAKQDQYSNMMSGLMGIPTAVLGGWAKGGGANPLMSSIGTGVSSMGTGISSALSSLGPLAFLA